MGPGRMGNYQVLYGPGRVRWETHLDQALRLNPALQALVQTDDFIENKYEEKRTGLSPQGGTDLHKMNLFLSKSL